MDVCIVLCFYGCFNINWVCSIRMIFSAAIGTNTGLSRLFAKAKQFAPSKKCRGTNNIEKLHSKINTIIEYPMNGKWQGKQRS